MRVSHSLWLPASVRMSRAPFVLDPILELDFGSIRIFVSLSTHVTSIYSVPFLAVPLNEQPVSGTADSYKVSSTFLIGCR